MALGKWVGLKYGYAIFCEKVVIGDGNEIILECRYLGMHSYHSTMFLVQVEFCRYDPNKQNSKKQKGHLHWVAQIGLQLPTMATINLIQVFFRLMFHFSCSNIPAAFIFV